LKQRGQEVTDIASLVIRVESLEAKTATKNLEGLTNAGGMVEGMVKKLAAAFAAWQVAGMVKESALLAARYETLGVVMGVMGNNAGYTAAQMAQFQQGLEATGISMVGARQSLNMMAAAQLDLSKSSDLARVAQDAAVISGTNSTEAFEALTRSIQTGMVIIAHRAGIMVNYNQAEKDFAATLGKTQEQLTNQELSQARLNAVLEEGRKRQGAYEASMETAGKQLLSMERYVENFKVKFGQAFGPILKELVSGMSQGLKAAAEWIDKNAVGMANFGEAMRSTAIAGEAFLASLSQMAGGAGTASNALDGLSWVAKGIGFTLALASDVVREAVIMLLKTMELLTYATYKLAGAETPFAKWADEIGATQQATDKFLTSIEQGAQRVSNVAIRTEQLASAQEMINEYTREYDRLQKAMVNAPHSVTAQDKDLLNQLGILRDYAKQRKIEIANGLEEVTGPRTTNGGGSHESTTTVLGDPEKYTQYGKEIVRLKEEMMALTLGEEAAYKLKLKLMDAGAGGDTSKAQRMNQSIIDYKAQTAAWNAQDLWDANEKEEAVRRELKTQTDYNAAVLNFRFAEEDAATKLADENGKVNASLAMQRELYAEGAISGKQYTDRVMELNKQLHIETGIFGDLRDTIQDWSKSSTDAFVDFCTTGENSFKNLVNSMLRDLARLAVQKQVMDPLWGYVSTGISAWMGGTSSGTESTTTDMGFGGTNDISGVSMTSNQAASASKISIGEIHINAATGTATTEGVSAGALSAKVAAAMREAAVAAIVNEKRPGGHLEAVGAMR
jgi:hypothetical protein